MYRLVLYYLLGLFIIALLFGSFGFISINPIHLIFSTIIILAACAISNLIFAKSFNAQTNVESVYITAFILALLISPVAYTNFAGIGFLIFASAWAMASKFIFAINQKHIFNPAAFGIALSALVLNQSATWWAGGSVALLPFVFFGGLLIVRKIHRFDLVISFSVVALLTILATSGGDYVTVLSQVLLYSPFFFLAFVMLTEPLTMPPTRLGRIFYGALVGLLFAPAIHLGSLYFTPELALLAGNLLAYFISPEGRFTLTLIGIKELATGTYEFIFKPDFSFDFKPGQYLEWTLSHASPDSRGNRRYFTIASSPTENELRLGVKFYEPKSSFKNALAKLKIGDTISVSHLAGDFTLPKNNKKKLAFIAGGIGVTPFRSQVKYLIDTGDIRSVTLLYANKSASDVAYKELFDGAEEKIGMKSFYHSGKVEAHTIVEEIPDYKERTFYISGPRGMVESYKKTLLDLGVSRFNIKTDYFPGFV